MQLKAVYRISSCLIDTSCYQEQYVSVSVHIRATILPVSRSTSPEYKPLFFRLLPLYNTRFSRYPVDKLVQLQVE